MKVRWDSWHCRLLRLVYSDEFKGGREISRCKYIAMFLCLPLVPIYIVLFLSLLVLGAVIVFPFVLVWLAVTYVSGKLCSPVEFIRDDGKE